MIGKISIGKSFGGCLHYCLNDKVQQHIEEPVMEGRAEVLMYNQCYGSEKEVISQFNEVRKLNPNLSKPVMHITLSLSPGENLPKGKLMEICEDCAKDMGFEKNQYIAVHHKDTTHQHLHIVANRVGFDRKTVSDSNSYQKVASCCRKMEQKFELKEVLSPRKFLSQKERLIPRHDLRKEQLKKDIQQALIETKSYPQFEAKMTALSYQVLKGRGISFTDSKNVKIKGSEVGFPLMKIEKIFALKKEHENEQEVQQITHPQRHIEQQGSVKEIYERYLLQKRQQQSAKQVQETGIMPEKKTTGFLEILMKPEHVPEPHVPSLLVKKKKEKKRPHGLHR